MSSADIQTQGDAQDQSPMHIDTVLGGPAHDGGTGQGLIFKTTRGDLKGIMHQVEGSEQGVIWVYGARGGFGGPGPGTYARLAESFMEQKITSLRLDYRQPNSMEECVLDLLAGIAFMKAAGHKPVVIVGHSFDGAVVIATGVAGSHGQSPDRLAANPHLVLGAEGFAGEPALVVALPVLRVEMKQVVARALGGDEARTGCEPQIAVGVAQMIVGVEDRLGGAAAARLRDLTHLLALHAEGLRIHHHRTQVGAENRHVARQRIENHADIFRHGLHPEGRDALVDEDGGDPDQQDRHRRNNSQGPSHTAGNYSRPSRTSPLRSGP